MADSESERIGRWMVGLKGLEGNGMQTSVDVGKLGLVEKQKSSPIGEVGSRSVQCL